MLMHVVAATNDITEGQLRDLRKYVLTRSNETAVKYKFDDAVRFQKVSYAKII